MWFYFFLGKYVTPQSLGLWVRTDADFSFRFKVLLPSHLYSLVDMLAIVNRKDLHTTFSKLETPAMPVLARLGGKFEPFLLTNCLPGKRLTAGLTENLLEFRGSYRLLPSRMCYKYVTPQSLGLWARTDADFSFRLRALLPSGLFSLVDMLAIVSRKDLHTAFSKSEIPVTPVLARLGGKFEAVLLTNYPLRNV